jgi:uncharacterized Fe-S cluster protein YjdI/CDGSH-type Zn-finger protein
MSKEHEYTNGEVTIVWKKDLCSHSTKCWRGLPAVFKPGQKPWILPEGAGSEAIVAQVRQCPSGALSIRTAGGTSKPEATGQVRVEASPNGPLLVKGPFEILRADGRVERREGSTALCRCGASGNKPYCDGSHWKAGFRDGDEQASDQPR